MKRFLILGAIVGTGLFTISVVGQQPLAPASAPQAPGPGFAPVDSIEKLADGLYRIPGGGGNAAVWVRRDGVLLVDTKVPDNGKKLLDLIRSVTDRPITHIINTHTHADHTGSNAFFAARVEVVAQENTATNMARMDMFKTETGRRGLPDKTYKDRLTLFKGRDAVDLYYFGPAHTNGDTLVVFRRVRVMHAGDMFAGKGLPLIDINNGGSGVQYGLTIAKAAAVIKDVDKVITGHSDVMTWPDFVEFGDFNRDFLAHLRAQSIAGKTSKEILDSYQLPTRFKGYSMGGGGPFSPTAAIDAAIAELNKG